jgi:predicted RND superfamily exporter protein
VPVDEAITEDGVDKNQMCCAPAKHQGGRIGSVLENYLAPVITTTPVNLIIIFISLGFCGLCAWQMTELNVEDAMGKFIPDDSYVYGTMKKMDTYFGTLGTKVDIVTKSGDYFSQQSALANIGSRLDKLDYLQERSAESYSSWVDSFRASLKANQVAGVKTDSNGYATVKSEYYAGLQSWLKGQGGRFAKDVIWVDKTDPQKGIRAARISTEFKNFNKIENDKLLINTDEAVRVMDGLRDAASSWSDVPGGAFSYTFRYLGWETFRIIKREMFMNVGLCMIAVLVITMVFLAHPVTGGLVLLCVAMIIVDILGCMKMWGLAIDNVTVIQLVVAVGLAVDYSAHVAHGFMTKDGTRAERVKATLGDVGSAVLNGGVSTFLAVMLLAVSKSYVFRVLFMSLFLTVVLGLAHGMIVLPAFLCLIGPQGYSGRAEAHSKSVEPVPDKVGASAGA